MGGFERFFLDWAWILLPWLTVVGGITALVWVGVDHGRRVGEARAKRRWEAYLGDVSAVTVEIPRQREPSR